jgi:hypothetical protein|tara:strand:- start:716 stop:1054 length:339 start_codon:yes stop_codon:yes gene_type:complete
MSTDQELQDLEDSMNDAKHFIDIKESTVKLFKNKEFKKVVLDYYFKEEAARLVMAKASSLTPEQKNLIDNMIYGIGALSNFFDSVLTRGMQAEQALREDENARTEILQEDLS